MKTKQYPVGEITKARAWTIAGKIGKPPPYKGYALDLENGQLLGHNPDGKFVITNNIFRKLEKDLGL